MYNYEHEIPIPDDKAIKKFLACDYFHDSIIADVTLGDLDVNTYRYSTKGKVKMKLYSASDCEEYLKNRPGEVSKKSWDDRFYSEANTYYMIFEDVEYYHCECEPCTFVYLNGRFKDSYLVRKTNSTQEKKKYHFRIQVTGGYIDIVFSKFKIRKAKGRVNYSLDGYRLPQDFSLSKAEVKSMVDYLHSDEFDSFTAFMNLSDLFRSKSPECLSYAKECLSKSMSKNNADWDDFFESRTYSAYIIGKFGDENDIPIVKKVLEDTNDLLVRRHLQDALELLEGKKGEDAHDIALEKLILDNKNDLIEDTFCYKLFEECVFDDILFLDLINTIDLYFISHQAQNEQRNIELCDTISWIICNIYNCIIAHNDENDLYHIKNFDMNLWKNSYADKLSDLTKGVISRLCHRPIEK